MAKGLGEFVEKNLDGNRKKLFRIQDKANIFDIPTNLHTSKSESLRFLEIDELSENQ